MNRRQFLTGSAAIVTAAATIPLDIAPNSLMEACGGEVIPAAWLDANYAAIGQIIAFMDEQARFTPVLGGT